MLAPHTTQIIFYALHDNIYVVPVKRKQFLYVQNCSPATNDSILMSMELFITCTFLDIIMKIYTNYCLHDVVYFRTRTSLNFKLYLENKLWNKNLQEAYYEASSKLLG